MLPEIEQLATVVVCDDDDPTRQLLTVDGGPPEGRLVDEPAAGVGVQRSGVMRPALDAIGLLASS